MTRHLPQAVKRGVCSHVRVRAKICCVCISGTDNPTHGHDYEG